MFTSIKSCWKNLKESEKMVAIIIILLVGGTILSLLDLLKFFITHAY